MKKQTVICPVKVSRNLTRAQLTEEMDSSRKYLMTYFGFGEPIPTGVNFDMKEVVWQIDFFASLCAEYHRRFGRPHEDEGLIYRFSKAFTRKHCESVVR